MVNASALPEDTRARLIAVAERLFAEQGVGAVSLREIVRLAGARNASALQYHFGGRAGLVRALLDQHGAEVDVRRHALLDGCEVAGPDLRGLAAALVLPLAAKLATESGRDYLRIYAEILNQPRPLVDPAEMNPEDSLLRWRDAIEPFLDGDAVKLHRRFVVMRFVVVELARRADDGAQKDDRLFVSHLIDLTTALLTAALSPETRAIYRSR